MEGQERLPKIGYLGFGTATPPIFFQNRMRELGYSEGKNIEVEYRFADGRPERLLIRRDGRWYGRRIGPARRVKFRRADDPGDDLRGVLRQAPNTGPVL